MKRRYYAFKERYFRKDLDFRARLFNVLALCGIVISLFTTLQSLLTRMWGIAVVGVLLMVISWCIMSYAGRSGNYQRCYYITVVAIFMIFFPVLFFVSGGYRGGMPSVCIFAALFTMLMLNGWQAFAMMGAEMVIYLVVTWLCYRHPEWVTAFATEAATLQDVQFGYVAVGVSCGIVVFLHLREYDQQRDLLKEKNDQLREMDEAKSAFLTTVAHEVKNPLNIISLHAQDSWELTAEDPLDLAQIRENQHIINDTVMKIDRILGDLMDTVSIEQGRLQLSPAPMLLADAIRAAAQPWQRQYQLRQIQTNLVLELEDVPPIFADFTRINQVLSNLLINAFRHTQAGTVTIRLRQTMLGQEVCVADNGEGMDEALRKRALEGYVSASKDYWRHGIGLYVCHRVVQAHGGQIWIESKKNVGTRVYFTLPQKENN